MAKEALKPITFRAIKYKYIEDDDGEATLSFKISLTDKLATLAIPVKQVLKIEVSKDDG